MIARLADGVDRIDDFQLGAGGDVLDLGSLLQASTRASRGPRTSSGSTSPATTPGSRSMRTAPATDFTAVADLIAYERRGSRPAGSRRQHRAHLRPSVGPTQRDINEMANLKNALRSYSATFEQDEFNSAAVTRLRFNEAQAPTALDSIDGLDGTYEDGSARRGPARSATARRASTAHRVRAGRHAERHDHGVGVR